MCTFERTWEILVTNIGSLGKFLNDNETLFLFFSTSWVKSGGKGDGQMEGGEGRCEGKV